MELRILKKKEKPIFENLLQLYLHEISYYFPASYDSKMVIFNYDDINKYYDNTNNIIYLIVYGENNDIIGFILVDKNDQEMYIQEIFVLNHYKNQEIGTRAVNKLLDMYKANWTIKSLPNSKPAERFWKRTIKNYTNDNYKVEYVGKYSRAVFTFSNINI